MRKPKRRPSTILVKQGNRVVIDHENRVVSRYLRGDFSVMRFDEFKQLTPPRIEDWYKFLGYQREGKVGYLSRGATCVTEGCNQPRFEHTSNGKVCRNRFCREHYNEHRRANRQKKTKAA